MSDEAPVRVERFGKRGEIVLDRPERKNSLTGPLAVALREAVEELGADDSVSVILIRGEGGTFCAGLDLKLFRGDSPPEWVPRFPQLWADVHAALFACPKPTVGALEQAAIAGGSALALACDFLVVGEGARLHASEARMGMNAPVNLAWAIWKWGPAVATRLVVAGQPHAGAELVRMGLAVSAVPDESTLEEARAFADRLAENSAPAMSTIKETLRDLSGVEDFRALLHRAQAHRLPRNMAS